MGRDTTAGDGFSLDWDTLQVRNQGDATKGTVNLVAVAVDSAGALTAARDSRRVNVVNHDLIGDGYVGCADIQFLLSQYGKPGPVGDLNRDGTIGIGDLSVLLENHYPPPAEPACS